jgi:hypothetical protein
MMVPPAGVSSHSSSGVSTVGSVVQFFAAVNPAVIVRPYAWSTVVEVELVPGPFVANVA